MRLQIVETVAGESPDVAKLFHQMQRRWSEHLIDALADDLGSLYCSTEFPDCPTANRLLDAALPSGLSPERATADLAERFPSGCLEICPNPHAGVEQTRPWAEYLLRNGWTDASVTIYRAGRLPNTISPSPADVRIIPARASYRHTEQLFAQYPHADAMMRHLDDPHYDLLIALRNDRAIASAGVLSGGETALIEQVCLTPEVDDATTDALMSRLMQSCIRANFRHVLAGQCDAVSLLTRWGFRPAGHFEALRPKTLVS